MERWILMLLIGVTLNLVSRTQQDVIGPEPGSGDEMSGNEDTTSEHPNEDLEGSADDLTLCQRQRKDSRGPGAFRPRCTSDGKFKPMQCDAEEYNCWCVDKDGKEITGSRQVSNKPDCKAVVAVTRKPHAFRPDFETEKQTVKYTSIDSDDIVIDETSTPRPMEPVKTTDRKTSRIQTTAIAEVDYDHSDDTINAQKPSWFSFLLKDPLILAGIIGGAVLALLCIVLLVMFTIYRMRKKDEGSYALDEPKKSYGFAYTRARDREFFA